MHVRGPNNVRRAVQTDPTCDIMGVVRPTMLRPFAQGFNLPVTFKAPNDRLTLKLRNSRLDSYHTINQRYVFYYKIKGLREPPLRAKFM